MKQYPSVIVPKHISPRPESHEREIAWILARHFQCRIEFLIPIDSYKTKTADIVMNGIMWEIKSPKGNSVTSTIQAQFKRGAKQSRSLIIDGRRTKLTDTYIQKQIILELRHRSRIKRVIYITKSSKVNENLR